MDLEQLNNVRMNIFLDNDDVDDIISHGILGVYKAILKNNHSYINGKTIGECTNDEIYNHLNKFLNSYLRKYSSFRLRIDSTIIPSNFEELFKAIPKDIPVIIAINEFNANNTNWSNKILNSSEYSNIYLEVNDQKSYDYDYVLYLYEAIKGKKLLRQEWDDEQNKDIYKLVERLNKQIDVSLSADNNYLELINKIKNISSMVNEDVYNNVIFHIEVNNVKLFRQFGYIIADLESSNDWPYDKIEYNLSVTNVENEIKSRDTNSFMLVSSKITIDCNEVHYDNYGEFQYFNNFSNYFLSKIPGYASDLFKIVYISFIIIHFMKYDKINYKKMLVDESETPHRSYYQLAKLGIGVCRDYARLTKYFSNKVGIKCDYIGSETYDYERDKNIPGKIKYHKKNGRPVESKYIGHAFNIVYIDGKSFYLDNTWIDEDIDLNRSASFLVSTETFSKSHGEYIEVKKHDCPQDYSREDIYRTVIHVKELLSQYSLETISQLYDFGQNQLAQTFLDIKKR